jgi:hypothetical protein
LPSHSNLLTLLFADDTALAAEDDDIYRLTQLVNLEFKKICTYFRQNRLSLHPDQTKFLVISNSRQVHISNLSIFIINNNPNENGPLKIFALQRMKNDDVTPAIKYLGVYFDPQLNFKYQVRQIVKKLSVALFTLRNVKNVLPLSALKTLYYSIFHCHLTYAVDI